MVSVDSRLLKFILWNVIVRCHLLSGWVFIAFSTLTAGSLSWECVQLSESMPEPPSLASTNVLKWSGNTLIIDLASLSSPNLSILTCLFHNIYPSDGNSTYFIESIKVHEYLLFAFCRIWCDTLIDLRTDKFEHSEDIYLWSISKHSIRKWPTLFQRFQRVLNQSWFHTFITKLSRLKESSWAHSPSEWGTLLRLYIEHFE